MLMILDDTSTIKAFTYVTNTENVEYLINKELHIINIWLKLHTYVLIVLYNVNPIKLVLLLYIIIKILIKQYFSNA